MIRVMHLRISPHITIQSPIGEGMALCTMIIDAFGSSCTWPKMDLTLAMNLSHCQQRGSAPWEFHLHTSGYLRRSVSPRDQPAHPVAFHEARELRYHYSVVLPCVTILQPLWQRQHATMKHEFIEGKRSPH